MTTALSPRQREVLQYHAAGYQAEEIAFAMNEITVFTVRMHSKIMREKLGAKTIGEAVAIGYRIGLLE